MGRFNGFTAKALGSCVSPQVLDNHTQAVMCVDRSLESGAHYAETYGPVAKRNLGIAAGVGKEYAVDFAMTTAEIYRQDCKSEQRGRDADFFVDPSNRAPPEENSLLMGTGESKDDIIDDGRATSVAEQSSVNLNAPTETRGNLMDRSRGEPSPNLTAPAPFARTARFPKTNDLMGTAPPRAPTAPITTRSVGREIPLVRPRDDLRATRLDLFRTGTGTGEPDPSLARAAQDLDRQDQIIDSLKRQLQMNQSELDATVKALDDVKEQAKQRQYKSTEDRAKAIQERKKAEERYHNEARQTIMLQETVAQLQVEISSLKMTLRGKQKQDPQYFQTSKSFEDPSFPSNSTAGQVMSMRAEIVELRSQLAEAHAQLAGDSASVRTFQELDDLRDQLRTAEEELASVKEKEDNYQKLKEQLFLLEYSSKESKTRLEDQLKKSSETEIDLRSELQKTKAALQRLEREKSRKQLASNATADRTNKELEVSKHEIEKLKEELTIQKSSAEDEIYRLSAELDEVKEKLFLAAKEGLDRKNQGDQERRQVEKDLVKQGEVIKTLQEQIFSKDEKLIAQVRQIAELESLLSEKGIDSQAFLKKISTLERELQAREVSEASLRQELHLQKDLLKEEREIAKTKKANAIVDKESVLRLKERLQRVTESANETQFDTEARIREATLKNEVSELKAEISRLQNNHSSDSMKEDILLKEISLLKAQLQDSEAKCEHEMRRAQEERRMSKEAAGGHGLEIERLRTERDESLYAKHKLEDELAEMRKKLVAVTQENASTYTTQTQESEASQISENVLRLRNELAHARARLASARDQSRTADDSSASLQSQSLMTARKELSQCQSPKDFASSRSPGPLEVNSSLAPPVIERLVSFSPSPDATRNVPGKATHLHTTTRSHFSSSHLVTPEKDVLSLSMTSPASRGSSDLQKRLEESKKRLDKANSRLETLLAPRSDSTERPLQSIVVVESPNRSLLSTRSTDMMDEVYSSPSGNIEIRHRASARI